MVRPCQRKDDGARVSRPSKYTPELSEEICNRLAGGESLRSICSSENIPNKSTVLRWLFDGKHEEFCDQYAKAREAQAEHMADELMDIADDGRNDYMEREHGLVLNSEAIARSKLRVDTRKWIAARLLAKKYGDKLETTHVGDANRPIAVAEVARKW